MLASTTNGYVRYGVCRMCVSSASTTGATAWYLPYVPAWATGSCDAVRCLPYKRIENRYNTTPCGNHHSKASVYNQRCDAVRRAPFERLIRQPVLYNDRRLETSFENQRFVAVQLPAWTTSAMTLCVVSERSSICKPVSTTGGPIPPARLPLPFFFPCRRS